MSITREQLKVGGQYRWNSLLLKVTLIYMNKYRLCFEHEDNTLNTASIEYFIENVSLLPKPKKKIKLIGYLRGNGTFHEFEERADMSQWNEYFIMKKVSEREIEVEDG